jgi:hypothetical protein
MRAVKPTHPSSAAGTRTRRRIFELKDDTEGSRYVRRTGHGKFFKPGDPVRESGIYEVIHDRNHREAHEVVMIANDSFPPCDTCFDLVRFRLVRTAPYIFQDDDFEEPGS